MGHSSEHGVRKLSRQRWQLGFSSLGKRCAVTMTPNVSQGQRLTWDQREDTHKTQNLRKRAKANARQFWVNRENTQSPGQSVEAGSQHPFLKAGPCLTCLVSYPQYLMQCQAQVLRPSSRTQGYIHPLDAYQSSFGVQDGHWETSRECSDPESGKGSSASRTGRLSHVTARSSYECWFQGILRINCRIN